MDGISREISELRAHLEEAEDAYYLRDDPVISDHDYDTAMRRLRELEQAHPELDDPASPTHRVGGAPAFSPVAHAVPLQSLQDIFSLDELGEFLRRCMRDGELDEMPACCVEPKIDGLSVALTYELGVFKQGATRGDGVTGEDVTHNLLTVKNLPKTLRDAPERLVVRGEVYMPKPAFEALNGQREREGQPLFANPRNAAAGSLRQLDARVAAKRGLQLLVFNIQEMSLDMPGTHHETLEMMEQWGLPVNSRAVLAGEEAIAAEIGRLGEERAAIPFDMDGAVVKIDDLALRSRLGATSKCPRWAVAYKYPPDQKDTVLLDMLIQVGRTGVLTPKALLEPVRLAGTAVRYATLHNEDFIREKDIRVGDTVRVRKAGEIIPEVIGVVPDGRAERGEPYVFPKLCPACGGAVSREAGEAAIRCLNLSCPAQRLRGLVHFCSRDAMDIEGLGPAGCAALLSRGLIQDAAGLYALNAADIAEMEGFGEQSAANLITAVGKSKTRGLPRLLYALGIRHVGQRAAKLLAENFGSWDALAASDIDALTAVPEIGTAIAASFLAWAALPSSRDLIGKLQGAGIDMTCEISAGSVAGKLMGKTFVVTGTLPHYSRDEAHALIQRHGGRTAGSVSKKTSFVLAGENAGSKLDKAISLGIPVITEDDWLVMVNETE